MVNQRMVWFWFWMTFSLFEYFILEWKDMAWISLGFALYELGADILSKINKTSKGQ